MHVTDPKISIITVPARALAGMHTQTTMENAMADYSALWEVFMPALMVAEDISEEQLPISYGVSVMMDANTFTYWAAYDLGAHAPLPTGMERLEVAGGLFAVTEVPSIDVIGEAYNTLFTEWLPTSEYEYDTARPCYELYDARYVQDGVLYLYTAIIKK